MSTLTKIKPDYGYVKGVLFVYNYHTKRLVSVRLYDKLHIYGLIHWRRRLLLKRRMEIMLESIGIDVDKIDGQDYMIPEVYDEVQLKKIVRALDEKGILAGHHDLDGYRGYDSTLL